jgi:hypothetical protein
MMTRFFGLLTASMLAASTLDAQASGLGSDYTNPGGAGSAAYGLAGGATRTSSVTLPDVAQIVQIIGNDTVTVTSAAAGNALDAARGNVASVTLLVTGLTTGGVPSAPATALGEALRKIRSGALRGRPGLGGTARLADAISAYNDATKALPAGLQVPQALLAVRWLLMELGALRN